MLLLFTVLPGLRFYSAQNWYGFPSLSPNSFLRLSDIKWIEKPPHVFVVSQYQAPCLKCTGSEQLTILQSQMVENWFYFL